MNLPSVYAYLDYRTFLRAWLDARKAAHPSYSLAQFARDGGGSKAAVANVLSGARNPRPQTLDAFARAMALKPQERNYLGLLVDLATAPSIAARRQVMERILAEDRFTQVRWSENEPEGDLERYLEHWYLPVIREMAAHPAFQPDAAWIARTLTPPIGVAEAEDALHTLVDLGMLTRTEDGGLEQREVRFRSKPSATQEAVARYHQEVVPTILEHLDTKRHRDQHLMAATILLPVDLLPEAKARIDSLVEQLATLADDGSLGESRIAYQLAVQLMPVSKNLSEDP